jgi:hypothetical protein
MHPYFRLLFLFSAVLFLGSCGKNGLTLKIGDQDVLALGSVASCNFVQSSQGLRVSWKSSTPVTFIISSSAPPEYDATIQKAAAIWNAYLNNGIISVHRDNSLTNVASDDRYNMIFWVTDWPNDMSQEQARTAIHWDVSKLRDADIKINATHYTFFKDGDTDIYGKISLLSIMIHEMGHGLGLKHIEDSSSVMQVYLASSYSRDVPGKIDTDSLGCEY